MGRHFPVREKSGNFEQTLKVRENHTKYWKILKISDRYYLLLFSDIQITCVLFAKMDQVFSLKNKTLKNTEKMETNTGKVREKSGNFVSPKKWEPCIIVVT